MDRLITNGLFLLQKVNPFHLHFFFFQKGTNGFHFFPWDAEADPAIRAEVPGNRDEPYGESFLLALFFCPKGKVDGGKENDTVNHRQSF